jgi:hypothetical protein
VTLDERFELADQLCVGAECEVGLEAFLERCEAQLLETGDLALGERLVGEVGERRAAPEGERLVQ